MMDAIPQDMALAALRAAANATPELSIELINGAYSIEKNHQFDEGREVPLRLLQRLVDDVVAGAEASK